ncbi:adenine deaminase [Sulfurimonas sp. HSL3-7]|uniref:adenine deaminase n=1 Tax=Sulfonitrofixus jiaomeiensis TaxID=3131938 RepID=UPI0031F8A1EF
MEIRANFVDIGRREIYPARVVIEKQKIASVTKIDEPCSSYILPGFIDAHIHIESSMLPPSEFARLAVRHGTVATVSDPHEIANVLGIAGVEFMLDNAEKVNFKFYFGASPCVPATPFETSGAALGVEEIKTLLKKPQIKYLSEVMNFPGVIDGDEDLLSKIKAAQELGKPVDGHAPGLRGDDLKRYIDAGIMTDHEAFTYEEGLEKIRNGMKIVIREGSAAKNFNALAPLIDEHYAMLMFCSDDRHPNDLYNDHINKLVKRALAKGNDLFKVLQIACINPIMHYDLDVGMLREGDSADFIEVDNLDDLTVLKTVINGEVVAQNGETTISPVPVSKINNFHTGTKEAGDFAMPACETVEVIEAIDHELITHEKVVTLRNVSSQTVGDPEHDILKIGVVNRYEDVAPAVAYVNGFGLKEGAIASSVAHDSHNIVAVGCSDEMIAKAVNLLIKKQGGICAVSGEESWVLPLEIAGIMSADDGFRVAREYEKIDRIVKERLGSPLSAPFMTLSFMALLVIPELKLSDKGLFDGRTFHFINGCKTKHEPF